MARHGPESGFDARRTNKSAGSPRLPAGELVDQGLMQPDYIASLIHGRWWFHARTVLDFPFLHPCVILDQILAPCAHQEGLPFHFALAELPDRVQSRIQKPCPAIYHGEVTRSVLATDEAKLLRVGVTPAERDLEDNVQVGDLISRWPY